MRVLLLLHPEAAGSPEGESAVAALEARYDGEVVIPRSADEARALACEAARDGTWDVVAAGGGDGTVGLVARGLLEGGAGVPLGLVPLGTANDLCRTLAIPFEPGAAVAALGSRRVRRLDVIDIADEAGETTVVNLASGGAAALVTSHIDRQAKERWGALAYIHEAFEVVRNLPSWNLTIRTDDAEPITVDASVVILGNGRSSAGGMASAPRANPEDGLLDLVVILEGPPIDVAAVATRFLFSDHLESTRVLHRRVAELTAECEPAIQFSCDGDVREPTRWLRARVRPQVLPVIVGEDYEPHPRQR